VNRRLMPDDDAPRQAPWMNTYADMVTLLLCFFVLLFAMSAVNAKKFQIVISSLQGALGIMPGAIQPNIPNEDTPYSLEEMQARMLVEEIARMRSLSESFRIELEQAGLADKVAVGVEDRGILFRFQDTVLFDLGKADLRPEAREVLAKIGELLEKVPNSVRVEGHTDNWPIRTERFPSNWELSTGRAVSVVRFLIEEAGLDPKRLQAAGYGEHHPLESNETAEGRQKNRRVDIILLRPSLSLAEPK